MKKFNDKSFDHESKIIKALKKTSEYFMMCLKKKLFDNILLKIMIYFNFT
jgi:hypothetical protein